MVDDETAGADSNESNEDEDTSLSSPKHRKPKKQTAKASSLPSDTESEESESWGRKKSAYYASNAGLLAEKEGEEDEEEANQMEEREARRLQARMRDTMVDEDFGLDDMLRAANDALLAAEQPVTASQSILSRVPVESLDRASAFRQLEKTSPETLALAREWDDVVRDLTRTRQRLEKLESTGSDAVSLGLSHLHHQTLLTYVTTLAFYLHVRVESPKTIQTNKTSSRVKPVLERLLTLKQALSTMEELDFDASDEDEYDDEDDEYDDEDDEYDDEDDDNKMEEVMKNTSGRPTDKLGMRELDVLLREADAAIDERPPVNGVKHHSRKSTPSSKRVPLSSKTPLFDLVEPAFMPSSRTTPRLDDNGLEGYGESTALSLADDTDKKARKRSLRFHTNKIETSARRRGEGREKLGGDDDIPYRERKKEKEARVRREVDKTRGEGGEDLDVDVSHDEVLEGTTSLGTGKRKRDDDSPSEEKGEDGYYELVKKAKKERKEGKKREYENSLLEARMDIVQDDASGPRSLTRAILKNKGLTPRRTKSVRNPRVKKRERFEKAKKKVRSQKAVYKGGLSGKPYGGEESGITKVVKSVKL
ncbi:Sas10 C-terminal domain-containing protein, partial [Gautieria morchelliformis]